MSDTAIVTAEVRDLGQPLTVAEVTRRYRQMAEFASSVMRQDVDFGVIPGTGKKPTLLKPGAEKLAVFFGLEAHFTLVDRVEDWEGGFFFYRYECQLIHRETGRVVGNAFGSCNTRESKYRWRSVPEWKATAEEKHAGRRETRTGRNGEYTVYVVPNAEPYDLVNTMDKMAQKRSLVAAVLVGTGASEFYTQDIEDFAPDPIEAPAPKRAPAPEQVQQPEPDNGDGHDPEAPWTQDKAALARFWAWAKGKRALTEAEVHLALGVQHLAEYAGSKQDAITAIEAYIDKAQAAPVEEAL